MTHKLLPKAEDIVKSDLLETIKQYARLCEGLEDRLIDLLLPACEAELTAEDVRLLLQEGTSHDGAPYPAVHIANQVLLKHMPYVLNRTIGWKRFHGVQAYILMREKDPAIFETAFKAAFRYYLVCAMNVDDPQALEMAAQKGEQAAIEKMLEAYDKVRMDWAEKIVELIRTHNEL